MAERSEPSEDGAFVKVKWDMKRVEYTGKEIRQHFRRFGHIRRVYVAVNAQTGEELGHAYIHFSVANNARDAVHTLSFMTGNNFVASFAQRGLAHGHYLHF